LDLIGTLLNVQIAAQVPGSDKAECIQRVTRRTAVPAVDLGFNPPSFAVRFTNREWERMPDSLANFRQTEMTNAANFFAAFEACLPAAYEVSCRIRTGSPTSFWLDSPRTVASRRSFGSPVPRRRGL